MQMTAPMKRLMMACFLSLVAGISLADSNRESSAELNKIMAMQICAPNGNPGDGQIQIYVGSRFAELLGKGLNSSGGSSWSGGWKPIGANHRLIRVTGEGIVGRDWRWQLLSMEYIRAESGQLLHYVWRLPGLDQKEWTAWAPYDSSKRTSANYWSPETQIAPKAPSQWEQKYFARFKVMDMNDFIRLQETQWGDDPIPDCISAQ